MMKLAWILIGLTIPLAGFGQEVRVIEKETKKAKITLQTEGNKQVPIFKILSETSGVIPVNSGRVNLNVKELELIGNAPMTIEVDSGLYEFQMYREGNAKLRFEAAGVDQTWLIKPKGEYELPAAVAAWAGVIGSIASIGLYNYVGMEKKKYDSDVEFYNKDPSFFKNPGTYSGPEYYMAHAVLGVSAVALVSGSIVWFLSQPSAKQVQ